LNLAGNPMTSKNQNFRAQVALKAEQPSMAYMGFEFGAKTVGFLRGIGVRN
jgi:hypothetical protein